MFQGEDQAPERCEDCGRDLPLQVLMSAAGYYIGTFCDCGPYSRASDYFPSREGAEAELKVWKEEAVRPSGRTPGYWPGDFTTVELAQYPEPEPDGPIERWTE